MLFTLLRKIPDFKGKKRIINWLIKLLIKEESFIVTGKYRINYFLPNLKESVAKEIFINGIYENSLVHFLVKNIPVNAVFFDVGANIGTIALPLNKLRPDIQIYCFEASPLVYSYLTKNCTLNNATIQCINAAVADKDGETVKFYSSKEKFGTGSMAPVFTKEFEEVQTITLSSFVKQHHIQIIDFMKVDVEGFETGVFAGMHEYLHTTPHFVFEFCDWAEENSVIYHKGQAQKILLENGYQLKLLNQNNEKVITVPIQNGFEMIHATKLK